MFWSSFCNPLLLYLQHLSIILLSIFFANLMLFVSKHTGLFGKNIHRFFRGSIYLLCLLHFIVSYMRYESNITVFTLFCVFFFDKTFYSFQIYLLKSLPNLILFKSLQVHQLPFPETCSLIFLDI